MNKCNATGIANGCLSRLRALPPQPPGTNGNVSSNKSGSLPWEEGFLGRPLGLRLFSPAGASFLKTHTFARFSQCTGAEGLILGSEQVCSCEISDVPASLAILPPNAPAPLRQTTVFGFQGGGTGFPGNDPKEGISGAGKRDPGCYLVVVYFVWWVPA